MGTFFIKIFLISWIHNMIESKYFFLIIFPLDINGAAISLDRLHITSAISSISL